MPEEICPGQAEYTRGHNLREPLDCGRKDQPAATDGEITATNAAHGRN